MKRRFVSKRSLTVVVLVLAFFVTFSAGTVTGYLAKPVQAAEQPSEFAVFWEAWEVVTQHFVDREKIDFTRMP
jgi:hypothetical protein